MYVQKNVATLIREIAKHTPEVTMYSLLSDKNGSCASKCVAAPRFAGLQVFSSLIKHCTLGTCTDYHKQH